AAAGFCRRVGGEGVEAGPDRLAPVERGSVQCLRGELARYRDTTLCVGLLALDEGDSGGGGGKAAHDGQRSDEHPEPSGSTSAGETFAFFGGDAGFDELLFRWRQPVVAAGGPFSCGSKAKAAVQRTGVAVEGL